MVPHVESVCSACNKILNLNMQAHVHVKPYCTYVAIYITDYLCNLISCSHIAYYLIYIYSTS